MPSDKPRHHEKSRHHAGPSTRPQARPQARPKVKAQGLKIKRVKAEVEDALKSITEQYNSKIERVSEAYAEKWKKITNVSAEEAWRRLSTKVIKIMQSPELAGEEANIIDILMPFLARIIRDRSTEHGMSIDLNLFAKYFATDGKYYYHWELMKFHSIPKPDGSSKSQPAIRITGGGGFTFDANAPLSLKERKPLLRSMTFSLSDVNVLELYEMVQPYLESD